jgi:hypothetical protein
VPGPFARDDFAAATVTDGSDTPGCCNIHDTLPLVLMSKPLQLAVGRSFSIGITEVLVYIRIERPRAVELMDLESYRPTAEEVARLAPIGTMIVAVAAAWIALWSLRDSTSCWA